MALAWTVVQHQAQRTLSQVVAVRQIQERHPTRSTNAPALWTPGAFLLLLVSIVTNDGQCRLLRPVALA